MYLQDLKSRKNIFNQEMCHDRINRNSQRGHKKRQKFNFEKNK